MLLRPASLADLSAMIALERLPESKRFVGQWSEERHRVTLASADARYFVWEREHGDLQGFAILRGLAETSRSIELKRIVVAEPGRGQGRRMLREVIRVAFEELGAHRLFLDVFEDNARARHLYESLGFAYEGTLREAALRDGEFCTLRLMSLLDREYAGHKI
jgi:diamine N-acetyltransferase